MRVTYITYPSYLDFSIEYINELKKRVELDVYVILTEFMLQSTILNITGYEFSTGEIVSFDKLKNNIENESIMQVYVDGCKSFNFIYFPYKSLSLASVMVCKKLGRFINKNKPDIIHFDDTLTHLLSLRFFLKSKNILINVHDPVAHSGERNWKIDLDRFVFYPACKAFILYSQYSTKQFKEVYKQYKRVYTLSLSPYYFYSNIPPKVIDLNLEANDWLILFFGRISKYKGIDDLLAAFSELVKINSSVKLIIAGTGDFKYEIPEVLKAEVGKRLLIINRFIANDELAYLMKKTKVVVCPYRDATQSGVVMTAFGFKKRVIVSKVGGLFEPVVNTRNGLVYNTDDVKALEKAISEMIINQPDETGYLTNQEIEALNNVEKLKAIYEEILL